MPEESIEKINSSFKFLLISRATRSIALIYVALAFSLYLKSLGYNLILIGIIFLFVVLFNMFISLLIGAIGDRIGYVKGMIIGEAFSLIGIAGLSVSSNAYVIIISAILAGISGTAGAIRGALSPGMTALIASNWEDEKIRVGKLATINIVASLSAIGGALLLYIHDYLASYMGNVESFRILFAVSFVFLLTSFISLFFLKERKRPKKTTKLMKKESFFFLLRIIIPNSINGAAIGIAIPLLPLWFELRYKFSVSSIGLVFTFAYIATAIGSYVSGKYLNSKNIRAISVSSGTRFFQGFLLILMALSPIGILSMIFYVARSAIAGMGAPMRSAISVRGIGSEDYGTASSIQGVITRGSQITSGSSGYLMDVYVSFPLLIGGGIQMIGSLIYYKLIRNWERTKNR